MAPPPRVRQARDQIAPGACERVAQPQLRDGPGLISRLRERLAVRLPQLFAFRANRGRLAALPQRPNRVGPSRGSAVLRNASNAATGQPTRSLSFSGTKRAAYTRCPGEPPTANASLDRAFGERRACRHNRASRRLAPGPSDARIEAARWSVLPGFVRAASDHGLPALRPALPNLPENPQRRRDPSGVEEPRAPRTSLECFWVTREVVAVASARSA
jgi:hypothetical protein